MNLALGTLGASMAGVREGTTLAYHSRVPTPGAKITQEEGTRHQLQGLGAGQLLSTYTQLPA